MPVIHRPYPVRPNRGSALVARPNRGSALVARPNGLFLGLFDAVGLGRIAPSFSKSSKYKKAKTLAEKYFHQYNKCKGRRQAKGLPSYPDYDKKGKVFEKSCRNDYLRWKKWEEKLVEAAENYRDKLSSKDKLTPDMRKELNRLIRKDREKVNKDKKKDVDNMQAAHAQAVEELTVELAAQDTAPDVEVDASGQRRAGGKRRRARSKALKQLGPAPTEETIEADTKAAVAEDPESAEALAEDEEEESGMSTTTMVALGVGGLVVLGLGAYLLTRNKQPAPPALP
jgi:hypothetical protein